MKGYYSFKKDKLNSFLSTLKKDFRLVTAQEAENGDFLFQETEDLEKISLDYDITSNTLKEFFFPQQEKIFAYHKIGSGRTEIISPEENFRATVFFGVRPCDMRAINFQDRFFSQEPQDNLYLSKRHKSIIISVACKEPAQNSCFCNLSGGPCLEKDEVFDLQFIDLSQTYLVETSTEKGEGLIKKYSRFFSPLDKNTQAKKNLFKKKCLSHFAKGYDIRHIYEKLKKANLKELWEELGGRCTNCGGCEFICPTCFCFHARDIQYSPDKGERIRAWDSCTFSGYSRMAGDINPHEKNSDRISRRFFCKLYNCYNWFGVFGCTGCGRCSSVCPVNLDMESFIASLMKANKYQPLLKEL